MASPTIGAVYVSNGSRNVERMIRLSQESLNQFHPGLPVHVAKLTCRSDFPDEMRWYLGSRFEKLLRNMGGFFYPHWRRRSFTYVLEEKMHALIAAPFDINVFLDADTVLLRSLDKELNLMRQGFDVVSFAEPRPMTRNNCELLRREIAKEVNLGAFLFNRRFIECFRQTLISCPVALEKLYIVDQALVSLCLEESLNLKSSWSEDLQIINDPKTLETLGIGSVKAMCREAAEGLLKAGVFHYIFKKRVYFNALRRALARRS